MRSCTCERLADPRSKIICHNFGLAPVGQIKIKFIVSPRGQERVVSVLYGRVLAFSNASKWKPFWPFLQALVAGQNKTNLCFFFVELSVVGVFFWWFLFGVVVVVCWPFLKRVTDNLSSLILSSFCWHFPRAWLAACCQSSKRREVKYFFFNLLFLFFFFCLAYFLIHFSWYANHLMA